MTRKLLLVAFFLTIVLTVIATNHQLTNAAANMAPPPQHAPSIASTATVITPTWQVVAGGGGKAVYLNDVSLSSSTDGWAVGGSGPGSYGALMHYDGATWSQTSIPTGTYVIYGASMISPTEGWAVGYNGCNYGTCDMALLMHYTPGGWEKSALPAHPGGGYWSDGFYGIDMKGAAGWIVGGTSHFLQFTGSSWTPITAPLDYARDVAIIDANEAWAVGSNYFNVESNITHWINGSWSTVTPTYNLLPNYVPQLRSVAMLDATEGWAVGVSRYSSRQFQCLIVHYTGGGWAQTACPSTDVALNSVAMSSPTDGWAVGYSGIYQSVGVGVIYHFNGSTWTTATVPSGTPALSSVKLVGANDAWAVGSEGTILRLVNGVWARVQGPNLYVGPISSVSANEVWYGGQSGQLYRWQNGNVTQYTGPVTNSVYLLDMITPTLGWGFSASPVYQLFRYANGTWTVWPWYTPVYAIDMISPDEGWIAEKYGVWHYTAGTFNYQSGPNSYGAQSLSMLDSNHGWAVSDNFTHATTVVTYTNGTWQAVTPTLTMPGFYQSLDVIGINPTEAWVAGWTLNCPTADECPLSGELDHYVGGVWINVPVPEWRAFLGISKVSAAEWWAPGVLTTGEYAALHYQDGVYTTVSTPGEDVQAISMLPDGSGFASGVGSLLWLNGYPYQIYLPAILH